jgi:hypothetical protein
LWASDFPDKKFQGIWTAKGATLGLFGTTTRCITSEEIQRTKVQVGTPENGKRTNPSNPKDITGFTVPVTDVNATLANQK